MMKQLCILSFAIFLLSTCGKKETTLITGTVSNAVNDSILPGVPINLWVNYNVSKKDAELISSTVSDSSGQYRFAFEANSRKIYTVVINYDQFKTLYDDPYYPKIRTIATVANGEQNVIDLRPATFGLVKLKIEKTGTNDSIQVKTYHQTFKPTGFETYYWTYRNGETFEDSYYQQVFVGTYVIDYLTWKNGIATTHLDFVEVSKDQSYNPVISY